MSILRLRALLFSLLIPLACGVIIERTENVSGKDFVVSWIADTEKDTIEFTVVAKTTGYVGFGISPSGTMTEADIMIGGIDTDGVPYFDDRYSFKHGVPAIDEQQDWFLISANESDSRTTLVFNRSLITCDPLDVSILDDGFTHFIWAMGGNDTVSKHASESRGFYSVYILDPPAPITDTSAFEPWDMFVQTPMPARDTSYWCTVHKTPTDFVTKRHIVGFEVLLNSTEALLHTHHLTVHHCPVTPGSPEEALLDAAVGTSEECYDSETIIDLFRLCSNYFYVWAKGGKPLFLPENVGIPINDNNVSEYFILEIHYDNPDSLDNVSYPTGVKFHTTKALRPIDGGLLPIFRYTTSDFVIPPNASDFVVNAHCSHECTAAGVPAEGIKVFNVLLHSHLAGRKMRLRQFRNGKEMLWVLNDEHYNFDYQQNRPLSVERDIFPDDQLTVECTYETLGYDKPVWGGLSTRHEMCEAFLMYYPRMELNNCGSGFWERDALVLEYGIEEFCNDTEIVCKPEGLAGLTFMEVLETRVNWTQTLIDKTEDVTFNSPHDAFCRGVETTSRSHRNSAKQFHSLHKKGKAVPEGLVTYPENYTPYIPPNPEAKCTGNVSHLRTLLSVFVMFLWWVMKL